MKIMFCDECHKNISVVYLVKVVNGKVYKKYLCEECAKKFWDGILSLDEFSKVSQLLGEGFDIEEGHYGPSNLLESDEVCPTCGIKLSDFRKSGRLGCSDCYESLKSKVSLILKRICGDGKYVGKIPKLLDERVKLELKVIELRRQLKFYVKDEEYEKAANLRDEIKDLEKQISLEVV